MPNNMGLRATRRRSGKINARPAGYSSMSMTVVDITIPGTFSEAAPAGAIAARISVVGGGGGGTRPRGAGGGGFAQSGWLPVTADSYAPARSA